MRSSQFDGSNDDVYVLGSSESTAANSPLMMEKQPSPPRTQNPSSQISRSASPAPMTGFAPGTSQMYSYLVHGFPTHDTYTATAIRG